jgi:hypothetical protein
LEALDGLILGRKTVASIAINTSNVSSSVLRASVISPLLCHGVRVGTMVATVQVESPA